ncbi:FAD-dependent monooxygenase [Bacillus salacetis]|uniref:FAD-dependent monooxygenase n=1 Tax=Bacillus salacetis TaxID=2315464 RepID=A0A3A1R092_9BACI|nr:NAD(P)/FAD-dependent oxidoreductase [Bacillus salacetis]RIW32299.1 FAD-dependent monooxygenase [Bacillus salacetis]
MRTDVFISGGGIGGLTLALKLAKCNIDVTVIERLPGPTPVYKGELLQPKSLKIFDELGLLDRIKENGHEIDELNLVEIDKNSGSVDESNMKYNVVPSKYSYSLMIHHEKLKGIIREAASEYPSFHYRSNSSCKGYSGGKAIVEDRKEKKEELYESSFYIGAEGRVSVTREEMGIKKEENEYNHHFLTVTFPRPPSFTEGKIISTFDRFLGLFPLPNDEVRSVYLIPAGEYKELRKKPIEYFHELYIELCPEMEGYVNQIDNWKTVQLMVPIAYHTDSYTKGNKALIGDAVHTVHPMAGEGMNMAIQDADVLGELLSDMYAQGKLNAENLKWFPHVRRERVTNQMKLSHLSALAYSFPYRSVGKLRKMSLKRIEQDPILHFKQMLNISGLGMWQDSLKDRMIQGGLLPKRNTPLTQGEKEVRLFTEREDYPWKWKEQLV